MNDIDPNWALILRKAAFVGRKVAWEYPGIEASDIEQEILLHVAENKSTFAKANYSVTALEKIFFGVARKYAATERYAFIHASATWIYTPKEIRALFENAYFDKDMWQRTPQKDEGATITAASVVVSLWDLDNAFDTLSAADQAVIIKRYDRGEELDSSEKMRLSRAVDAVTRRVNNQKVKPADPHEGPGSRTAMSNASALAATANNY